MTHCRKPLITLLFSLVACVYTALGQSAIHYVWAPNGLNMRTGGAKSAPLLKKLPFGKKVTVLNELPGADSVKEVSGFYITGHWVKAVAEKDTGYLFDGYLLPWKPVTFQPEKEFQKYNAGKIEKFLTTHFPSATGKQILKYYPADYCGHPNPAAHPDECTQKYRIDFQGIILESEHIPEKNSELQLSIPNGQLQQVYLWALYSLFEENGSGQRTSYQHGKITLAPDGAGCRITLYKNAAGTVIWSQNCGC